MKIEILEIPLGYSLILIAEGQAEEIQLSTIEKRVEPTTAAMHRWLNMEFETGITFLIATK